MEKNAICTCVKVTPMQQQTDADICYQESGIHVKDDSQELTYVFFLGISLNPPKSGLYFRQMSTTHCFMLNWVINLSSRQMSLCDIFDSLDLYV